jgi:amylosucrase
VTTPVQQSPQTPRATVPAGIEFAHLRARFDAQFSTAVALLTELYGQQPEFDAFIEQIRQQVTAAALARPEALRQQDAQREVSPDWFLRSDRIGYVAYAERFAKTLTGVGEHLDYLAELKVTYFHLMSVLRPREGANDGGYAVVDYGDVDPALGSRADLVELADQLRQRGISLCLDLVLNHTAREHPWAQAARDGSARHREYYITFPDRTMPDRYEESLPEVFPTMAPGNFTWDDALKAWVWTTFNTYQWDLNYANPQVFAEMLGVMLNLANLGVDVLRIDAIAFTWKRLGTNCQNQPEAHLLAQAFRALVSIAAPGVLLKAEAIVPPDDLVPYLGAHRRYRPECHIAYHNQLMVMLWSSLATQHAHLATEALAALPPTPPTTSFVTYLRCHDDIGWAVDDADAGAAGINGGAHRAFLAAFYRGDVPGSWARGAPFSSNPDNGDERTSGTAAALCGLSAARETGAPAAIDRAVRRLLLGYGVVLGFGGIPLLYMGDELGLDNDLSYLGRPDQADESRWMHRPSMPWEIAARRERPGTVEHRIFSGLRQMIEARQAARAMSAGGQTFMHRYADTAVLAWERSHPEFGHFFGLANVADRPASVPEAALGWASLSNPIELLNADIKRSAGQLIIPPLSVCWFVDQADTPVLPCL